jgi:hypothetical protein
MQWLVGWGRYSHPGTGCQTGPWPEARGASGACHSRWCIDERSVCAVSLRLEREGWGGRPGGSSWWGLHCGAGPPGAQWC